MLDLHLLVPELFHLPEEPCGHWHPSRPQLCSAQQPGHFLALWILLVLNFSFGRNLTMWSSRAGVSLRARVSGSVPTSVPAEPRCWRGRHLLPGFFLSTGRFDVHMVRPRCQIQR